jgi:hypothetical protein
MGGCEDDPYTPCIKPSCLLRDGLNWILCVRLGTLRQGNSEKQAAEEERIEEAVAKAKERRLAQSLERAHAEAKGVSWGA